MVRLKRFELLTHGLEGRCSIQLSYRRMLSIYARLVLERVMGIEPTRPAWKAGILPLNYTRKDVVLHVLEYYITRPLFCQYLFEKYF